MPEKKLKNGWIIRTFKNPWYFWMVVAAFIAVISFFQVNSWWADQHHFNGWWKVIGIFFGVVAIAFLIKANRSSTGVGS